MAEGEPTACRRRGGRKARLARGGIREHEAFLGYEMRGPAGTGRDGVMAADGWQGQGAGKKDGACGHCLPSPLYCFLEFDYIFRLFVSIRQVANEYPFCTSVYMNSYVHFYVYFFLFISCQTHI